MAVKIEKIFKMFLTTPQHLFVHVKAWILLITFEYFIASYCALNHAILYLLYTDFLFVKKEKNFCYNSLLKDKKKF